MSQITINQKDITYDQTKQNFNRKSIQFTNDAVQVLKDLGICFDFIDHSSAKMALRRQVAWISWYANDQFCAASCNRAGSYVDNMQVVSKMIKEFATQLSFEEFNKTFEEDSKFLKLRVEAREFLGVDSTCQDLQEISKKYKLLAKKTHPDTPEGDQIEFKKVNAAYGILKKELS